MDLQKQVVNQTVTIARLDEAAYKRLLADHVAAAAAIDLSAPGTSYDVAVHDEATSWEPVAVVRLIQENPSAPTSD